MPKRRRTPGRQGSTLAIVPTARMVAYGHVGDGNLHFNVSEPAGGDRQVFLESAPAIQTAVHALVREFRGSISTEHGIGQQKRQELERYKSDVELDLMRTVKAALDPAGILNPGKVL